MTWQGRTVLVTGAGGFIGGHLAERLVREGAAVRALVRYNSTNTQGWLGNDVEVIAGDVRDHDGLRGAFDGVDTVFHLAALIGIPYSYHSPVAYTRVNTEGTINVLQAARDTGVRRVVHTSTSEVYGTARYVPMDEAHPVQAQSPYAASKAAADAMAAAFTASYGLPVVTVRPFNTFGPRQSVRAVIPTIITQALADAPIRLGSLTPTRDLTFVDDTVDGFVRAAEAPEAVGRTFNLGTGRETSIGDLVRMIGELLGPPLEMVQEPERMRPTASEVGRLVANASAAREVLGWEPTRSLEDGLRLTIEWMREHRDAYRPDAYVV